MKIDVNLNESGRSLIEMLAVLAVIGVLSVGTIFTYKYALNQHKANVLKSELTSMAITTSIKLSTTSNFRIYGNLRYPYIWELNDNQTFSITVSEIPKGVCSRLTARPWTLPYEILVNDIPDGRCQDENEMKFSFYNSLNNGGHEGLADGSVASSIAPPEDFCRPSCRQGCTETCKTDRYWCWSDGCACYNGKNPPACTQVLHCSSEPIEFKNCAGEDVQCCPDYEICTPPTCPGACSVDTITITRCDGTTTECCPDGGKSCTSETDCCNITSDCTGTDNICVDKRCTCQSGYTKDTDGNCGACPTTTLFRPANASECLKCSTAEHPYEMKHGLCEPVAKACTQNSECSYMYGSCINDVCGCPEKDYFRNENGNCTKCTETVGKLTYQEECNRCGNRFYENGYCKLCASTKYVNDTGTKCIVCPTNGSIFKPLNETGCNNCNTAEHPYQMVGNICKPKVPCTINDDCGQYRFCVDGTCGCPEGYFQNKNGNCTDCGPDGPNGKETFDEECAKCNGARHMVDGKCNRV